MLGLMTTPRPRASVRRNSRGPVGAARLAARRESQYITAINAESDPRKKLWQAVRWLKAVCARRPDRTLRAVDAIVTLARDLSGEDYR